MWVPCLRVNMCGHCCTEIGAWLLVWFLIRACVSAMTLRAERAACAHSASVVRGILCPRKDRSEGNSPNRSAENTTPSGPSVSLQALTARLSRNFFYSLGWSIWSFRLVRLMGSWYLSPMPNALWCCVPDLYHSTSWISVISTKVSLNYEPSSKTRMFGNLVYTVAHNVSMVSHTD